MISLLLRGGGGQRAPAHDRDEGTHYRLPSRGASTSRRGPRAAALAWSLFFLLLAVPTAGSPGEATPPAPPGRAERDLLHAVERGRPGAPGVPGWAKSARMRDGDAATVLHSFDALHHRLDIDFDLVSKTIAGDVEITALVVEEGLPAVTLDLVDTLVVDSVRVDDVPAAFLHAADTLGITLPAPASAGDTIRVRVYYHGSPANEGPGGWGGFWWNILVAFNMGVGLYTDPPSMARAWFPCYDRPEDKATLECIFTVPLGKLAVSNGLLTTTVPDSTAGTVTYTWKHDFPISTYLVAVGISDYEQLMDAYYPFVSFYVYPYLVPRALVSFSNVHYMMDAFVETYGPYPFDKFCFLTASKGDMEHQTCVTHLASLVNGTTMHDDILAHELSHMWWGDGVTVADWRDVWLSEGFGTYSEAIYFGWRFGPDIYASQMRGIMDYYLASGETGPLYDPDPLWGATSYEKGASVLHMLRHVVGDSLFFAALRAHWSAYAYGNHVTPDFQATVESVTSRDLDWFFEEWVYSPGYPVYAWSWWTTPLGEDRHLVTVTVDQTQTVGPVFAMPIDLTIQTAAGDTSVVAWFDGDPDYCQFTIRGTPTGVLFDPGGWVLMRATQVPPDGTSAGEAFAAGSIVEWSALPNPTPGETVFRFRLVGESPLELTILDGTGRRLRTLNCGSAGPGEAFLVWDGRDGAGREVAPGVYVVRVRRGAETRVGKVLIVR